MNNIYKITKSDFEDARIKFNLPPEIITLYDSFMNIKESWEEEFYTIMAVPKPREIKLFFRNTNTHLKYIRNEINSFPKSAATVYIDQQMTTFIKYNLKVAKLNMLEEKPYTFVSDGEMNHKEIKAYY